jgi:hypothetical protein
VRQKLEAKLAAAHKVLRVRLQAPFKVGNLVARCCLAT